MDMDYSGDFKFDTSIDQLSSGLFALPQAPQNLYDFNLSCTGPCDEGAPAPEFLFIKLRK